MTDLAVIVVSYKRPDMLARTLDSINKNLAGLTARVIVADNETSPETQAVAKAAGAELVAYPDNKGLNFPFQTIGGDVDAEFVCTSDDDVFYARPFKDYIDFLKNNPDVMFAKGLDSPEHVELGHREFRGERWSLKRTERGGGLVMRTETLRSFFPLPDTLLGYDSHLLTRGHTYAVLPGTVAHMGYQSSRWQGETPEKFIERDGAIIPNTPQYP